MVEESVLVLPILKANMSLYARLAAVFKQETFAEFYPEITAPKVYQGFPKDEPPFFVVVDEIADDVSAAGGVSMGHAAIEFTTHVWIFARHRNKDIAAKTMLAYADVSMASILADQTLDMAVDGAQPSITSAGTAADSSNRYIAAASLDIRCNVGSVCPGRIKEIVNETNCNL